MSEKFYEKCITVLDSIYKGYSEPEHLRLGAMVTKDVFNELIEFLGEKDLVYEIDCGDEVIEYALTDIGLKAINGYRLATELIETPH